jgi:PAS domain S-box-containing protein
VFAAARDITAQKSLERQFRQAQDYNRGLIESSVDAMLTVAPDLTITDVNEQMVRLTGYSRENLIGTAFKGYFTEPERAEAGVRQTLNDGFVTNYELLLRSRHRREFLVSFNASVFKDMEGNVQGIFAVARDVTEQRRLEEQLRESQIYNRGLIESSIDALVTVDPDLTITDVNEQMVKLIGYSRDELIGSAFKGYFTEPERAAAGVRQTLSQGSVTNYELVLMSRAGKRTVVSFNAGTFKNAAGHIAGIFAAARDITDQKRLEEQLREQQNYNRSLIESSVDALLTVDPGGIIADVNEQTVKLTGFNRKQLIGSPFIAYFTEPEVARTGVDETFSAGLVTNYELVLRTKSGRKVPVSFNAAVFHDTSGAVAGILAAARENTQQKQIQQEMREQQTYTRSLIESNIDALMTTDTIGVITDVNVQMCTLTGRKSEDLIGTPFKDYFTDPARAEDGIRRVLAEDRVTNYELTMRAKDGKETVVSYNAATFRDAAGHLKGAFAAARDITAQKLLEEQIRNQNHDLTEATAFLNNVLESSTEYSIIAMDLAGNILAWNEGARRNYGYAAEEMVGKGNSQVLHIPDDISTGKVSAFFETAVRTGKAEGVFERIRKNGEHFTASVAMTLRRDADNSPVGFVLISKDIAEQKRLEEQLRRKNDELEEQNRRVQEANRLKSEFLANMSHELRTPLNSIIGFSEILHDGKVGPVSAKQKEYVGDVLTSAHHLLQLINDVLDLSKVESGKMEFLPESIDPKRLVGEVRDILRTLVGRKRIHLQIELDPALSEIVLDPGKLKQVLFNYLSNAIKFTPEEGYVTIVMRPEGTDHFILEVKDTGIGIKAEDIKRLFVEFQQLDASASKKYQGTGLGLALTKRIVEAQGGEVGVTSAPGEGSIFFARLPRVQRAEPATMNGAVQPHGPLVSKRHSVLVIEDNARDREWLVATLNTAGYEVRSSINGADAIKLLDNRRFDAITLDLILPDMSGWDVMRHLREAGLNRGVPVVVVTVLADEGGGVGFAVRDFLEKPTDQQALLGALRRAGVSPAAKASVMLVDDDETDLKLYETALEESGFSVEAYTSADDALRAIARNEPDVIVLDLLMPGIDGFEFMRRLRATDGAKNTPVVVLTAKDLASQELESLKAAARTVVLKGSGSVDALLEEVRSCFSSRELPSRTEESPETSIAAQGKGAGGQAILVVEDDELDRNWLITTLTEAGYGVTAVATGREALEQLQSRIFSAVTVDLMLPDMSGWDLIRRLRSEGPNRNTIVLLATVVADKSAGLAVPIHDYLIKPIQPNRLLASLAAIGVAPYSGQKIIFVDDEIKVARLLEPVVREWGYEPSFAESGAIALEMIRIARPAALIVDLMMPVMSGFEFLATVRCNQANRAIPAIVMTAKDLSTEEMHQLSGMAQSFVHKGSGTTLDLLEALHEFVPVANQAAQ